MKVTVNGESREIEEGTKLARLIEELGVKEKVMAAAVNMEIVKKAQWPQHELHEGDRVELLHFVGGG
jgi:sulfur carrier protein